MHFLNLHIYKPSIDIYFVTILYIAKDTFKNKTNNSCFKTQKCINNLKKRIKILNVAALICKI